MAVAGKQVAGKVPFTLENVGRCLCPGCPVQARSKCVAGLKVGLAAALKDEPLKRERIPGVYCSTDKATCTDLDASKNCLCGSCGVYTQYNLGKAEPGGKYCAYGASK